MILSGFYMAHNKSDLQDTYESVKHTLDEEFGPSEFSITHKEEVIKFRGEKLPTHDIHFVLKLPEASFKEGSCEHLRIEQLLETGVGIVTRNYKVPVTWEVYSTVNIEAGSAEEAIDIFRENTDDIPTPIDHEYVDASFRASSDSLEEMIVMTECEEDD